MNVSLIARLWPEVKRFEKASERKEAVRYATEGIFFNPYHLLCLVGAVVALVWLRLTIEQYLGLSRFMQLILAGVMGGVIGTSSVTGALFFSRRRIQTRLRERLNAAGLSVCMACGYSLSGLDTGRCPECGRPYARAGCAGQTLL